MDVGVGVAMSKSCLLRLLLSWTTFPSLPCS